MYLIVQGTLMAYKRRYGVFSLQKKTHISLQCIVGITYKEKNCINAQYYISTSREPCFLCVLSIVKYFLSNFSHFFSVGKGFKHLKTHF